MNSYIIDGVRTPVGNYQGTLSPVRTDDLAALVISEIAKKIRIYLRMPTTMSS